MRWAFFAASVGAVALVACSVDPSLTCGQSCADAADVTIVEGATDSPLDTTPDSTGVDASLDASPDAPVPVDANADVPTDSPLVTDGPCTTSCPNGTTCNGSFCQVPQGTACSAAVSTAGASGALDGTVCSGSGPTITTTCTSPMTASASFVHFTSGGDPWNVTVKAVNGPLQIEVMTTGCGTGSACYDLASGASTLIVVNQNSVIAIVNGNGTSCTNWEMTYVSK